MKPAQKQDPQQRLDTERQERVPHGFEGALGRGRGSDRADEQKAVLTPRERVREYFTWFNQDRSDVDRLNQLIDENQKADELGLFASHGHWRDLIDSDAWTLTCLADIGTGESLAIIEMSDPGNGTLYLPDDHPGRWR